MREIVNKSLIKIMNILMDIFVNFNPSQELFEMMRDQLIKDYVNQLKNPHNILRQVLYFVWIPVSHWLKQKWLHSAPPNNQIENRYKRSVLLYVWYKTLFDSE